MNSDNWNVNIVSKLFLVLSQKVSLASLIVTECCNSMTLYETKIGNIVQECVNNSSRIQKTLSKHNISRELFHTKFVVRHRKMVSGGISGEGI